MWQQVTASLGVVGALLVVITLCPAVMSTPYDDGLCVLWSCKLQLPLGIWGATRSNVTYQSVRLPAKGVHSPAAISARTSRPVSSFEGSHFGQNSRAIRRRCQDALPPKKHADSVVGVTYLFLVHSADTLAGTVDTVEELWHASDTFVIHLYASTIGCSDRDITGRVLLERGICSCSGPGEPAANQVKSALFATRSNGRLDCMKETHCPD
jgi:hypothetical protein